MSASDAPPPRRSPRQPPRQRPRQSPVRPGDQLTETRPFPRPSSPPDRLREARPDPLATAPSVPLVERTVRLRGPLRRFRRVVLLLDTVLIVLTLALATRARGLGSADLLVDNGAGAVPYPVLTVLLGVLWLLCLAVRGSYAPKRLGAGAAEFKAVASGSVTAAAAVAIASYLLRAEVSRAFFAVVFLVGPGLLLLGRYAARQALHERRRRGRASYRTLVVGGLAEVTELVAVLRRESWSGHEVVGVCLPAPYDETTVDGIPVVGSPHGLRDAVLRQGADSVIVAAGAGTVGQDFRRLTWQLDGTGVDLAVAPSIHDVAGPRIHLRPIAGLPLLHLELPEFTGPQRTAKRLLDTVAAGVLLVVLAPVLAGIALLVRLGSPGPALFRQVRVGQDGAEFWCLKFRTMVVDAEERLDDLRPHDDGNGLLFKVRDDPRVTWVGRPLRRFSLDELPQLVNVLRGEMSLVGPRPPLPEEVASYSDDLRRRLRVRPGLTGLWQVSGRSDLSLEESTRLDLYYVDNWSLMHDVEIVWKTMRAVLEGRGAY